MKNVRYKNDEENDEETSTVSKFNVECTPTRMQYVCRIDEDFNHVRQFEFIVDVLQQAKEEDTVRIEMATGGGKVRSILPLLEAIKTTSAHVHVHGMSDVASAGTFVLLLADSVSFNDYVTVMFHNVSFGSSGTGNQVAAQVAHTLKNCEKLLRDVYEHFFTEDEILRMLSGTDFYMGPEEFLDRHEKRSDIYREAMESIEDIPLKIVK